MDKPNPHRGEAARLKALMAAAGLKSWRLDPQRRALLYAGRCREWVIAVSLHDEWFRAYTVVCNIPAEAGLRARLNEAVLQANGSMTLTKFSLAYTLILEIEYRAEHMDAAVLGNLTGYLYQCAEAQYPKVFRIVSGDETLDALAGGLQLPGAAL